MNANVIITLIKKRRDELRNAASAGSASEPSVAAAAEMARSMASEYDSLLAKIEASIQAEATVDERK